MKLNPDCIRDLLLVIEEAVAPFELWQYDGENPEDVETSLQSYTSDEILYHLNQMEKADLIETDPCCGEIVLVIDLTPNGHEFLANIRENTIWNGVKEVSGKVGASSLNALSTIASNVITQLIKAHFGLYP